MADLAMVDEFRAYQIKRARELYALGQMPTIIAARLGVNCNTLKAWLRERDPEERKKYRPNGPVAKGESVSKTRWLNSMPSAHTWYALDQATDQERALMRRLHVPGA